MKILTISYLLALSFWFLMFSPLTGHLIYTFYLMVFAASVLTGISFLYGRKMFSGEKLTKKNIILGIISAFLLYGVFFIGNEVSTFLFPFAKDQIQNIYLIRSGYEKIFIILILFFLIGPAEEIYWRGFVQNLTVKRFGNVKGIILSIILYTSIHIPSLNFMLISAAFVAGVFWGLMYFKFKSIYANIISHALWDCAIFVIFPINN